MNKTRYQKQAEFCKKLIYEYEKTKELDVINQANLGGFYRYINKRLTCKSGVAPLKADTGEMVTDDGFKANMLNDYFCTVFTHDDGSMPYFKRRVAENVSLRDITVTMDDVLRSIKKCKPGHATGPDSLSQNFIKKFGKSISVPLTVLFNSLLQLGSVPSQWKLANITPILKKGLASDVRNYRPISLTSVFCKLLERIIQERMLSYLIKYELISRDQHGFLAKHSTCTQLLECVNDWSLSLRNRHMVDAIYLDFKKAFDSVSHAKLKLKLEGYGIEGSLLSYISNFLSERFQSVNLPGGHSVYRPVFSSLPQDSVLGPLLFILYINDIVDLFPENVIVKLFADDVKIYMEVADVSDMFILQDSINFISEWAKTWQLKLAYEKCQYIRIGVRNLDKFSTDYYLNDCKLPTLQSVTDLGILVDCNLSFANHVDYVVSKAKLRASQILRCFLSKDHLVLTKAFVVYVRPLLEYCSAVWSPCRVTSVDKLESVQRTFTRRLQGLDELSYDERLKRLDLERLELRRLHFDLEMCYKVINHLVDVPCDSFFKLATSSCTRGHPLKLSVPESRVNARAHAFPVRVIFIWNRLPTRVVLASNLFVFKKLLRGLDLKYALIGKQ